MTVDTESKPRVIVCGAGPVGIVLQVHYADTRPLRWAEIVISKYSMFGSRKGGPAQFLN
jgi:hypothetical protein